MQFTSHSVFGAEKFSDVEKWVTGCTPFCSKSVRSQCIFSASQCVYTLSDYLHFQQIKVDLHDKYLIQKLRYCWKSLILPTEPFLCIDQRGRKVVIGSLSNDNAQSKMNLYLTNEIHYCLNLLSMPTALKNAQAKYATMGFNSKCKYNKIGRCHSCSSDFTALGHLAFLFCRK